MAELPELNNTYILMRHGFSWANQKGKIATVPENDEGLTPLGFEQAEESSKAAGLDSDIVIVSSPLPRARETGGVLREVTGAADLLIDDHFRERGFGDMELQSADLYHDVWVRDAKSATHCYHGVESLCQVAERGLCGLSELERKFARKTIVIVGHADPHNIFKAALWGRPLRSHRKAFSIANAEMQTVAHMRQS